MKIIKCDRCGKEIDCAQGRPVFAVIRTNTSMCMDMCDKCRRDLINFMHCVDVKASEAIQEAENEDN